MICAGTMMQKGSSTAPRLGNRIRYRPSCNAMHSFQDLKEQAVAPLPLHRSVTAKECSAMKHGPVHERGSIIREEASSERKHQAFCSPARWELLPQ